MSIITTYQNFIKKRNDEISRLKREKERYNKNIISCNKKIEMANKKISSTKSASMLRSKTKEIERENKKKMENEKKVLQCDKKIANKESELVKYEEKLRKEQEKQYKNREIERKGIIKDLTEDISSQKITQRKLMKEVNKLKKAREKINVLFIASNPDIEYIDDSGNTTQQQKLKLEKEAREIHESIQKSLKRDSISFETRWATRVTDLFQFINEVNPTIIHFSGHCTDDGELVFQDNNDEPRLLNMDTLIEIINASTDNLRLVVLNNCYSSIIAEKIVENIESAIGMNDSIGDEAAIVFASQLYSSIGFGLSLEKSFQQALIALKIYEIPEEKTPELFTNIEIDANDIYLVSKDD